MRLALFAFQKAKDSLYQEALRLFNYGICKTELEAQ